MPVIRQPIRQAKLLEVGLAHFQQLVQGIAIGEFAEFVINDTLLRIIEEGRVIGFDGGATLLLYQISIVRSLVQF